MKHAHEKFDAVQDTSGRIPVDEPVFLLRGQDQFAPNLVRLWSAMVQLEGNSELAARAYKWADEMERWPVTKLPD